MVKSEAFAWERDHRVSGLASRRHGHDCFFTGDYDNHLIMTVLCATSNLVGPRHN
jgi:hypothetical protein